MNLNKSALDLVKSFEGCRLDAYLDSVKIPTIGYGHTRNVKMGDTCTQEQADAWLLADLREAQDKVDAAVKVPLTENQYGALVSFVYNIGHLGNTMLWKLNQGNYEGCRDEFEKWCHAGDKILPGLLRRRLAEKQLFMEI